MLTANEALVELQDGNRRYVDGAMTRPERVAPARRVELMSGQAPFAVILACSDSRVPVETVFDQGLGDLFVIRVAGNVVTPSQLGSIEFAVDEFGTRLVVVMGHSNCGAVTATLEALEQPGGDASPNLSVIVDQIRPAIEPLLAKGLERNALIAEAVRANTQAAADDVLAGSAVLRACNDLVVVGAEYDLESGQVSFLDVATEAS